MIPFYIVDPSSSHHRLLLVTRLREQGWPVLETLSWEEVSNDLPLYRIGAVIFIEPVGPQIRQFFLRAIKARWYVFVLSDHVGTDPFFKASCFSCAHPDELLGYLKRQIEFYRPSDHLYRPEVFAQYPDHREKQDWMRENFPDGYDLQKTLTPEECISIFRRGGALFLNSALRSGLISLPHLEQGKWQDLSIKSILLDEGQFASSTFEKVRIDQGSFRKAAFNKSRFNSVFLGAVDLFQADFKETVWEDCEIELMNAREANFDCAKIDHCSFQRLDLEKAHLADLVWKANRIQAGFFIAAHLPRLQAEKALFAKMVFTEANLEGANLRQADLFKANLSKACLNHANLESVLGYGLVARQVRLDHANLKRAFLPRSVFTGSSFIGANLEGANLSGAQLQFSNLSKANLSHADLTGANLFGTNLNGADLSHAILERCELRPYSHQHLTLSENTGILRPIDSSTALQYAKAASVTELP